MIKDKYLRLLFIPLLGILNLFFSDLINYSDHSTPALVAINLYFILLSYCIWTGFSQIHRKIRFIFKRFRNPFVKVFSLSVVGVIFGSIVSFLFAFGLYKILKQPVSWSPIVKCITFSCLAVVVLTMVYEILFLSNQRNLYTKIVDQLDWERSKAEMSVLKNELEPHFIFNCLNTLSYLILNDPQTAHTFNSKMATVYKYFLINKDRELITLQGELEFIENYFFVLQVRHDNKLNLVTEINNHKNGTIMILPYALQILVENAIKHNEFTNADPLNIRVILNGDYIHIKNNKKPKPYLVNSTGIGLRNLSSRYRLICNKDIQIETTESEFTVKLPLIKSNL
ncbi:MAG: histidine kinase [Ginsengibacter sp.]